jgi:hypothetical protein
VTDPVRFAPTPIVDAVDRFHAERIARSAGAAAAGAAPEVAARSV